jgi:lysozyme
MKFSNKGIAQLAALEGIVPAPYYDSVGVLTFGIGHTAAAGAPDPANMPMGEPEHLNAAVFAALLIFARDADAYAATVDLAMNTPTQNQFDAGVSFHYNTGAIGSATWVDTHNAGDFVTAGAQFMNWSSPPEVIPRRETERLLYDTGVYEATTITVWGVTESGQVVWTPLATIPVSDAVAFLDFIGR